MGCKVRENHQNATVAKERKCFEEEESLTRLNASNRSNKVKKIGEFTMGCSNTEAIVLMEFWG